MVLLIGEDEHSAVCPSTLVGVPHVHHPQRRSFPPTINFHLSIWICICPYMYIYIYIIFATILKYVKLAG